MRQRAVVLAILQRSVRDTPPALPARPSLRRFGQTVPEPRRAVSS